jgi:hypothetical protein
MLARCGLRQSLGPDSLRPCTGPWHRAPTLRMEQAVDELDVNRHQELLLLLLVYTFVLTLVILTKLELLRLAPKNDKLGYR